MSGAPGSRAASPAATDFLLRIAAGRTDGEAVPALDGADVSASGLGARPRDLAWWNEALGGARLAKVNLAGVSLRRADLSGADLSGADLARAVCSGVILRGARLEEANLHGADLIGSDLSGIDGGEADFSDTLLEDAVLRGARLRFSNFAGAVMDGADFSDADLWGAQLPGVEAQRGDFARAALDEAQCQNADLSAADLSGASLRRADLSGANLRGAMLRGAVLDGATLFETDFSDAVLPHVVLTGCDLRHARFAGAWLERTRMRAGQLGGAVGEEVAGDYPAAVESYIVLEQNFRSLGSAGDASWAFRRRRRMGKRLHWRNAGAGLRRRAPIDAARSALQWFADLASEWLCDYGESVNRVLRAFVVVLIAFAALYWATGCLMPRESVANGYSFRVVDYLLFSLDSMTTVGTSEVGIKPSGQLGVLLSSVQTVLGTVLLGLFGFVLGVRMRN